MCFTRTTSKVLGMRPFLFSRRAVWRWVHDVMSAFGKRQTIDGANDSCSDH